MPRILCFGLLLLWSGSGQTSTACHSADIQGCFRFCKLSNRTLSIEDCVATENKVYQCQCYQKQDAGSEEVTEASEEWFKEEDWNEEPHTQRQDAFEEPATPTKKSEMMDNSGAMHWFVKNMIFFPVSRSGLFGLFKNLSNPNTYDLQNCKNYRIPTASGSLGAWHLWPTEGRKTRLSDLDQTDTLVLYMHGNSATRGFGHRVQLYRLLTALGFHVVSFDYRGFGDSSPVILSEETVVLDGINVLKWINNQLDPSSLKTSLPLLLVWGHSLGTAIATHVIDIWQKTEGIPVGGLVLESGFTSMADEVQHFSLGRFLSSVLHMNTTSVLQQSKVEFQSSTYLKRVVAPTLVLHAEDDRIVPAHLGEKLYKEAVESGKTNIRFLLYPAELRLRHRYIYSAPHITQRIQELWRSADMFRRGIHNYDVEDVESIQFI